MSISGLHPPPSLSKTLRFTDEKKNIVNSSSIGKGPKAVSDSAATQINQQIPQNRTNFKAPSKAFYDSSFGLFFSSAAAFEFTTMAFTRRPPQQQQ